MGHLKFIVLTTLLISPVAAAKWTNPQADMVMSQPVFQETRTGGVGKAQFFLVKGSISYITVSDGARSVCNKYPNAVDDSPIIVEGIHTPATSWCSEGNMFTSIEGKAGQWVFERLWKQSSVTIDGWEVDATGFQQAVRKVKG